MTERNDEIARLIVREMGKPLAEARGEAAYAAEFLRWFSEEAVRANGDFAVAPAGTNRMLVTHAPIGIALLITPWNFPAAMATRKIGPALAAGCTVVLKPAEETPLTALAIVAPARGGGRARRASSTSSARDDPAPLAEAILADPRVRKLSFTGSTAVGRRLLELGAPQVITRRWSSAATRPSSCSTTPTSTSRSPARWTRRCATAARPARPRTASSCTSRSPRPSRRA